MVDVDWVNRVSELICVLIEHEKEKIDGSVEDTLNQLSDSIQEYIDELV